MKQFLMHKDTPVAEFTTNTENRISQIKVLNDVLFPWSAANALNSLNRWILQRKTMTNRPDIAPIIRFYGSQAIKSDAMVSLFDCYWIKQASFDGSWDTVNPFYTTDFYQDGLYLSVVNPKKFTSFTENSPNLTIPGKLPMFWHMEDMDLGLICSEAKEDMSRYKMARDNNIIIFKERKYLIISNIIYTFVKTQTSPQTERIPFDQLYFQHEDKNFSVTKNLLRCCEKNNIPNWEPFIRQLIKYNTISKGYKIELSDVGVLRDADTLQYTGFDLL